MNPKLPQTRIKSWENLYYRYGMDYFVSEKTYAILLDCFKGKVFIDNKENQAMIYRFKIYKELKDLLMEEKENEKRCTSKNQ